MVLKLGEGREGMSGLRILPCVLPACPSHRMPESDPLRKSLAMWLNRFIRYPPRQIVSRQRRLESAKQTQEKRFASASLKPLVVARGVKAPATWSDAKAAIRALIAQGSRVWCRTSTLRAKTTKHSYTRAWAWVMISSSPTKKSFPGGYAQTHCGTSRYRFLNPRRQLQTTRRRLGARKDWRSCPYFIARRRSAFSSRAEWKMRATSLHWSVCMAEPRTSY